MSAFDDCRKKYDLWRAELAFIKRPKAFFGEKRGSEENVKNKIVVPLIQCLGWNLIRDLNFEFERTDILVSDIEKSKEVLIVEVKPWHASLERYSKQCLKYTYRLNTPWVFITSGSFSRIYSSLINPKDLSQTKPIFEFSFDQLITDSTGEILSNIYRLIGKEHFIQDARELKKCVQKFIAPGLIDEQIRIFRKIAAEFTPEKMIYVLEDSEFKLFVDQKKDFPVRSALMRLWNALGDWVKLDKRIRRVHGGKSIGIGFYYENHVEAKTATLFGIYPEDVHVSFGLGNWKSLKLDSALLKKMAVRRSVRSEEDAEKIIELVSEGLRDIIKKNQ